MKDRAAIDAIRGYFYQFDHSIVQLLELQNGLDGITVEGIEDIDVVTATEETAVQCKYYAKTEYNNSVIAKPIRQMLSHFKEVKLGKKPKVNYKLYGHFNSGQSKLVLPIDVEFLKKNFLSFKKGSAHFKHDVQLALNETDLTEFLSLLEIDITAMEYSDQLSRVFSLLKQEFKCNEFEAEHFYYNNALKAIKELAVEGNILLRRITKDTFVQRIDSKKILFHKWFVQFKGEVAWFSDLRKQYFTSLNVSPFERFFIIELPLNGYHRSELKDLIFSISKKWSKLSKYEPEPFCPYLYLHNISDPELIELKKELQSEGFKFIDGYDFSGAEFNPKSISKANNKTDPTKLKIVNRLDQIQLTLSEIGKTKEIYEFYIADPFFNLSFNNILHAKIQYSKLADIKKII